MSTPRGRLRAGAVASPSRGGAGAFFLVVARRPLTVRSQPTLQPSSSGRSRQILPGTVIKSRRVVQRVLGGRKHTFVELEDAAGGWVFTPSKSGVELLLRVDAPPPAKDAPPDATVSSAAAHPVAAPRVRPAGLTGAAMQAAYAAGHLVYKCTAPRDISIRCKDTFDLVMDTGLTVTNGEFVLVASTAEPKQAPAYTPDVGHGRGRGHGGRGRGRGGRRRHAKKHHEAAAPEPIMVTFIQLADKRGWLLDRDPSSGVEWMQCIEEDPAVKRAREDSVLKQAVIEEGKTLWKSESEQQLQKLEASLRSEQIALEETLEERVTEETGLLMRAAGQLKALQAKLKGQEAGAAKELQRAHAAWEDARASELERKLGEQKFALESAWASTKTKWERALHEIVESAASDAVRAQMRAVIASNGLLDSVPIVTSRAMVSSAMTPTSRAMASSAMAPSAAGLARAGIATARGDGAAAPAPQLAESNRARRVPEEPLRSLDSTAELEDSNSEASPSAGAAAAHRAEFNALLGSGASAQRTRAAATDDTPGSREFTELISPMPGASIAGGERGDAGGASPLEDELSSFDDDDLLDDLEGTEGDDLGAVGDRAGAGEDVDSDGY